MSDESDTPRLGEVWRYPFLWKREAARGETEGRKQRPCAMVLLQRTGAGETEVMLVPITTQPQEGDPFAIEIPEIEKRRAGLDVGLRLWVVTQEHNTDICERSYYLEPGARLGTFGASFVKQVQRAKIEAIKARASLSVRRY